MGDLRKDYVLDKFVVMHEASQAASEDRHSNGGGGKMPILPGNESMTEPATLALVVKEGMLQRLSDSEDSIIDDWSVRVFQSEKPLVVTGSATSYSDKPLYTLEPAYGYHQIVVASPEHNQSLSHISVEQWGNVLVVIQDRVRWLYTQKGVTYVSIYVNSGASAGAQVTHPHLNIVTFLLYLQLSTWRQKAHTGS